MVVQILRPLRRQPPSGIRTARELAGRITANPSHSLRLTKRLIREGLHSRLDTVLEMASVFQAVAHKTADHSEAVDAFLEKRPPQFGRGA